MASIGRDSNGRKRILFVGRDGKRQTVRVGKVGVWLLLTAIVAGCGDAPEPKSLPEPPAFTAKAKLEQQPESAIDFTTTQQLRQAVLVAARKHLPPNLTDAQFEAGVKKLSNIFAGKGYCFTLKVNDVKRDLGDGPYYALIDGGLNRGGLELSKDETWIAIKSYPPRGFYEERTEDHFRIVKLAPESISKSSLIDFFGTVEGIAAAAVTSTGRLRAYSPRFPIPNYYAQPGKQYAQRPTLTIAVNLLPHREAKSKKKELSN